MTPLASPTAVALRILGKRDGVFSVAIAGPARLQYHGKDLAAGDGDCNHGESSERGHRRQPRLTTVMGPALRCLFTCATLQRKAGGQLEIHGLRPEFQGLLEESDLGDLEQLESQRRPKTNLAEDVGRAVVGFWEDTRSLIGFVGELVSALGTAAMHPRSVRWRDAVRVAESAGVNALPIIVLVSFLVGVIMAFQAAVALRRFGAEIFVANLIGLSMLREMGPLMTAIILAGRSGSAFAAELGTMKVREEIDALKTMGLEPVRFLVVTRVLAAVVMTPLLTVFADLLGLMGGSVVMLSFGFPLITFYHQVQ